MYNLFMKKKYLLLTSFLIILFIAIMHSFALELRWYFTHRWIDILMHVLGGFWVAVTSLWIYLEYTKREVISRKQKLFIIFLPIILLGICWEVFELMSGNTFMHTSNFYTDSISDTVNNLIGGVIAYFYIMR